MERAGGKAIGFEIRGKKPCLVLELRKKKLTFTIIEADKMDFFFLVNIRRHQEARDVGRESWSFLHAIRLPLQRDTSLWARSNRACGACLSKPGPDGLGSPDSAGRRSSLCCSCICMRARPEARRAEQTRFVLGTADEQRQQQRSTRPCPFGLHSASIPTIPHYYTTPILSVIQYSCTATVFHSTSIAH
jgi:hypothetical protein